MIDIVHYTANQLTVKNNNLIPTVYVQIVLKRGN